MVGLFALETDSEIGRLVGGRTDQHAVVVDFIGENHLLDDQRKIGHFCLERQLRVGIQNIKFRVVRVLYIRITVLGRDGRLDCAGDQLKLTVGQRLLGVHRKRRNNHIFKAHRRAYSGRSGGIGHGIVLLVFISVIHP